MKAGLWKGKYASMNHYEYFAEASEAFFSRNDFFRYTNEELKKHDPAMHEMLGGLWGSTTKP